MVDNEEEYQNFNNLYQNSGLSSGESSPYLDKEDILSEPDLHDLQCGIIEIDELGELSNASDNEEASDIEEIAIGNDKPFNFDYKES